MSDANSQSAQAKQRPGREAFGYLCPVDSRWADNDVYGHINNVMYYSYFDSTINRYLIDKGGLDIHNGDVIAYVVSSGCDYFRALPLNDPPEVFGLHGNAACALVQPGGGQPGLI